MSHSPGYVCGHRRGSASPSCSPQPAELEEREQYLHVRVALVTFLHDLLTSQPFLSELFEFLQTDNLCGREFVELEGAGIAARHPRLPSPRPLPELHPCSKTLACFSAILRPPSLCNFPRQTSALNKARLKESSFTAFSLHTREASRKTLGGHVVLQEERQVHEKIAQGKRAGESRLLAAWVAVLYLVHTCLSAVGEKAPGIAGEAQGLCTAGKVSFLHCD